ncbi:hypothetical protein FRB99_007528 [Tulasnella sp. 403]|nr:hypothetical protein FRB99_007528 [Tulasnella sp. 403]
MSYWTPFNSACSPSVSTIYVETVVLEATAGMNTLRALKAHRVTVVLADRPLLLVKQTEVYQAEMYTIIGNKDLAYTVESISRDFTPGIEKPAWPLSVYGPAKQEATYVKGVDVSQEEMRVKAYEARAQGRINEYVAFEGSECQKVDAMYRDRLQKAKDTFAHMVAGGSFDPNGPSEPPSAPSAFGGNPNPFGSSVFGGSPSAFGAKPATFGTPASTSAFGGMAANTAPFGSSTFGSTPTPGFGQTSAFGANAARPSGFGTPTAGAGFAGFGAAKPVGFGSTPAFGQTTFGQPSTPAFGQSAFGQQQQQQSAFGQPSGTTTTTSGGNGGAFSAFSQQSTAFGKPSAPTSAFGQPAFGQTTQPPAFGQPPQQPSAFGQAPPATSAFGQTSQPMSAFGAQAFGQQTRSATQGFGQTSQTTPSSSAPQTNASSSARLAQDPFSRFLPPNYLQLLPDDVKAAFEKEDEFEWGKIPEWIPPVEMR